MRQTLIIPNGRIHYDDGMYSCPHCGRAYHDSKSKLSNRLQKSYWLTKRCRRHTCKKKFGIAVDMTSSMVGFELNANIYNKLLCMDSRFLFVKYRESSPTK